MKTIWFVLRPHRHELVEDIVSSTECATVPKFTSDGREIVFAASSFEAAQHVAVAEVLVSLERELGVKMPTASELLDRKAYQEWLCDSYLDCVSG